MSERSDGILLGIETADILSSYGWHVKGVHGQLDCALVRTDDVDMGTDLHVLHWWSTFAWYCKALVTSSSLM